jgi:hypothetical protein
MQACTQRFTIRRAFSFRLSAFSYWLSVPSSQFPEQTTARGFS